MEPLPLIPRSTLPENHDTSTVVREAFQKVLARPTYPPNIMENLQRRNIEGMDKNAGAAQCVANHYKKKYCKITEVEKEMMEHHGIYLLAKDILAHDQPLNECLKLKRFSLLPEVADTSAAKYNLIKQDTLLPAPAQRAIDFRLNSNRHNCEGLRCISESDITHSIFLQPKTTKMIGGSEFHNDYIFEAVPREIVFRNYDLNVTYKRTLKLRNVTKTRRAIALKVLPKTNYFFISLESSSRVAPGMCAVYSITYRTDTVRDLKETIVFNTFTGQDIQVKLLTCSLSPILRAYVFKMDHMVPKRIGLESISQSLFNIERTMALNSSIDCGHTLIGDEVRLSLIMKNEGGYGKFFFVNEADWFHYTLLNVTTNMEILAGVFKLYPAYFEVNTNEFVEVAISFFPKKYGLFVETVYLLCDNNNTEELDFMGDGVYFEKSFIKVNLKSKQCRPFFLDLESAYCLHLGKCLNCSSTSGQIRIVNNSPLNLSYRWRIRRSDNRSSSDWKHLATHWITLEKRIHTLHAYSYTDFKVLVKPETTVGGLYRAVLSFYIENIPEASLKDHQDFNCIEREDSNPECKRLDIQIDEVELLLEVETISIILEPNPLVIPFPLPTSVKYNEPINIIPQTKFALSCKWKFHKNNRLINIEPKQFEVSGSIFQCIISLDSTSVGPTEENFLLSVNDDAYVQHLKVILKTTTPKACFSPSTISFGYIMKDFLYGSSLYVENPSREILNWYIVEETIISHENVIIADENPESVYPNCGILKAGGSVEITYTARTECMGPNLSYLKLFSNYTTANEFDAICNVRFDVCSPTVLVHTDTSELPLITPTDMLFVGKKTYHHICIHNSGAIVAIFLFGNPTGPSYHEFDIEISPMFGVIKVDQNAHVDVKITPKAMGYFDDLYIPLFVLGVTKVTLVKLMCLVGDITVTIYIPDNYDSFVPILWPKIIPDLDEETYHGEFEPVMPISHLEGENYFEDNAVFEQLKSDSVTSSKIHFDDTTAETIPKDPTSKEFTTLYQTDLEITEDASSEEKSEDLFDEEPILKDSFEDNPTEVSYSSTTSYISSSYTESIPGRSIKNVILELFGNDVTLQEHCIEFQKVPLRTPVKKSIKIENMTPGEGFLYMEAVNFYQEEQRRNVLNDIMAKLKMAKSTEWEDIVTPDGIIIKIDEPSRDLHSCEIVEFDIWVYANTWGYYVDELVIDISQMLPFCASVLVEVVGQPIEYPIAQNTICKEPTVRMGVFPFKSEDVKRKVKVLNTSVVPVYISWQMFVNVDRDKKAFSVIMDMPISDLLCEKERMHVHPKFILTNEYYGQTSGNYFQVNPIASRIEPGDYSYVEVTTSIGNFDELFLNRSITATLVGLIKVACEHRIQPNLFVRPHGIDIGCTKVKITLEIELPILVVDDLPDRIRLSTYASDIMENHFFSTSRRLVMKNTHKTSALVYMEVEKPFRITAIDIHNASLKELKASIVLSPEQCMEVTMECVLSKEDILKIVDNIKSGTKSSILSNINFQENSLKIVRNLSIYQRGDLQKVIPLELKIYYPIFKAKPVRIKFGNVFVGNTAKHIVCLRNMTGTPLKFVIYKQHKFVQVKITPEIGTIPKLSSGQESYLSIFFTPTEAQTYQVWFAIATTIPHHYVIINIVGVGTYDENYYQPGLH